MKTSKSTFHISIHPQAHYILILFKPIRPQDHYTVLGLWILGCGLWIMHNLWFLDCGSWIVDFGFCVEMPIKLSRSGFSYAELPSNERKRISGKKNVNEFIDGYKILIRMIKLFFNIKITN